MGLSERKNKQKLGPDPRNSSWASNSSLIGHKLLASMGWEAGKGLGTEGQGMSRHVAVTLKQDNKGVGALRREKEERANPTGDVWVGGGGDFGGLLERLNAAAASASAVGPPAVEIDASSEAEASGSAATLDSSSKKRKRSGDDDAKDKDATKEEKRARKTAEKAAAKAAKKDKKSKKRKNADAEAAKAVVIAGAVAEVVAQNPAIAQDKAALDSVRSDVSAGRPIRLAHRAKFLRAKRMVGNDAMSVNEILGISTRSSPASSGTSTPTITALPTPVVPRPPVTVPGPGGSLIPLSDTPSGLDAEVENSSSDSESESSAAETPQKLKVKKDSKGKSKSKGKDRDTADAAGKADKSARRAAKEARRAAREAKRAEKAARQSGGISSPALASTSAPAPAPAPTPSTQEPAKLAEPEPDTRIGTNAMGLSVHAYLSARLMQRKAAVARQKRARAAADEEAVWVRAALVTA